MGVPFLVPLAISVGLNLITSLFVSKPTVKGPDLNLRAPKSDYGAPLPRIYGRVRLEGNKFWPDSASRMYRVETKTERRGGKGGFGGGQKVETKKAYGTFAVLFCQGYCQLERIIVNGRQIDTEHNYFKEYCTFFDGRQTTPWSEIVAKDEGFYKNIAYKGINYIGFRDVPLEEYGNQIPQQVSAVLIDGDFGEQPTLDLVVGDICTRAGVNPALIDVTELQDIYLKNGLAVPESGEGYRKSLEDLMNFYLFTAVETREGKIAFKKFERQGETPLVIPPEHFFSVGNDGIENQLFVKTTEPKSSLPNKVTVKYNNQNQNFDSDEVVEYFEEYTKENNISIDMNMLTSYPYEIKERARLILKYLYLRQKFNYSFSIPSTYIAQLDLLKLITLPNGETVQIHQLNQNADYKIDINAKYYAGGTNYTYNPPDTEESKTPPSLDDPTNNIPNIYILDIPQIDDYPPGTLYICATGECTVQASIDGGANYQKSIYHQAVSSIGNIISPLANGTGLDTVNTFDIEIESGQFDTITQGEFDSGQGVGLIARQVNGYWEGELIKVRDVQILTATTRRFSYISRQNYGTAYNPTQTKFFLLIAPGAFYSVITGSSDYIGQSLAFRPVVAEWQNLATTTTVSVTPAGNSYKPPAPSNLTGIIDEDGNIKLFWDYEGTFSPFNNTQEDVTFEISINGVRTLTSPTQEALYLVTQRTADSIGTTNIPVTIWAVSSLVGKGNPYIATITPTLIPNSVLGTGSGLEGITFISGNYTVLESDNNKVIVCTASTANEFSITFPDTLTNGFQCYVVHHVDSNKTSLFTIQGVTFLTRTHNNRIKVGDSRQFIHISEGKYFVLGKNDFIYDYIPVTTSQNVAVNIFYGVNATGITLTLPANPIEGSFIGFKTSPQFDFVATPSTLSGNGNNIEGNPTYSFNKKDEKSIFFYTGFQWILITKVYDNSEEVISEVLSQLHPVATTGQYPLLENIPDFALVAYTGNYYDLQSYISRNDIFSWLYQDLREGDGISITYTGSIVDGVTLAVNTEAIDDRIGTLITAGSGITTNYNDVANTLTISLDAEGIDDRVNALLVAGSGITKTYNDGANTLTLALDEEVVDDRVANLLTQGNGITLTYNDVANTLTVALNNEAIDDRVSALLVAGTNITLDYNDNANTLTINSSGTGGGGGGGSSVSLEDIWLYSN